MKKKIINIFGGGCAGFSFIRRSHEVKDAIFKFFEKWKQKRLNKLAKKMLKDNPGLEKSMKKMDDALDDALKMIKKGEAPYQEILWH